jgi:hypothetical protein
VFNCNQKLYLICKKCARNIDDVKVSDIVTGVRWFDFSTIDYFPSIVLYNDFEGIYLCKNDGHIAKIQLLSRQRYCVCGGVI